MSYRSVPFITLTAAIHWVSETQLIWLRQIRNLDGLRSESATNPKWRGWSCMNVVSFINNLELPLACRRAHYVNKRNDLVASEAR